MENLKKKYVKKCILNVLDNIANNKFVISVREREHQVDNEMFARWSINRFVKRSQIKENQKYNSTIDR